MFEGYVLFKHGNYWMIGQVHSISLGTDYTNVVRGSCDFYAIGSGYTEPPWEEAKRRWEEKAIEYKPRIEQRPNQGKDKGR